MRDRLFEKRRKTLTNVLLIGSQGQLGFELLRTCPTGVRVAGCDMAEVDIRDAESVSSLVRDLRPDVIVNAAAYTAVDQAESERELAFAVNASGAANVAEASAESGGRLIHLSTDFIFDGERGRPYRPDDLPSPISVYGASKAEGEGRVLDCLGEQVTVLRTSWLYSIHGRNFVKTILGRMASGDELRVVTDQVGAPTWARTLAGVIWKLVGAPSTPRVLHWSDAGVASWYDFAVAIQEEALTCGLLDSPVQLSPISSSEFPTRARRPHFSVLDSSETWRLLGRPAQHWRASLRAMLAELRTTNSVSGDLAR